MAGRAVRPTVCGALQSNRGRVRAGLRGERLWFGVGAPRATPVEIVEKLNKEINAALVDPTINAKLEEQGDELLPGSPAYFGKRIAEQTEQ